MEPYRYEMIATRLGQLLAAAAQRAGGALPPLADILTTDAGGEAGKVLRSIYWRAHREDDPRSRELRESDDALFRNRLYWTAGLRGPHVHIALDTGARR